MNLVWIEEFIQSERGMEELDGLLGGFVGRGRVDTVKIGRGERTLSETDTATLLEILKCFRALLNTDVSLLRLHVGRL